MVTVHTDRRRRSLHAGKRRFLVGQVPAVLILTVHARRFQYHFLRLSPFVPLDRLAADHDLLFHGTPSFFKQKKCRKTKTRFGIFLKIFTINYITFKSGKFAMKKENKIIPAPRREPS